jgi:hypothetical protein
VHTFADSNDGGRDGAFYGTWQQPPDPISVQDVPDGPFVLQCKHSKKADTTLTPSELSDEFDKVQALVERGLCGSYVLLTNARVSGTSEATIRQRLLDAGVAYPLILDGQWICDTIATRQRMRTFVPRVYGLGDLSQILDERAYTQAQALLGYLREELATFVVTDAYKHAVQAVQDHGFVLLLGEPAVGKSVIAATLAMTALDAWGCLTVNAHDADGLVRHWNPHEPNQFFWIDDAFGAVRHEQQLTDSWSRHMRHVMTAVRGGAKVVLTSRDYIYRDARPYLKEYAYPLLHEQQVVVDVAQLPLHERRQILYNHIKLGDQPREVRAKMKPHLDAAAATEPFHPEVARRLGQQAFTRHLELTEQGITDFMARPTPFLPRPDLPSRRTTPRATESGHVTKRCHQPDREHPRRRQPRPTGPNRNLPAPRLTTRQRLNDRVVFPPPHPAGKLRRIHGSRSQPAGHLHQRPELANASHSHRLWHRTTTRHAPPHSANSLSSRRQTPF